MKNNYKLILSGIAFTVFSVGGFAQINQSTAKLIPSSANNFGQITPVSYSPNFHHAHDHEKCFADPLTEDWIQSQGIAEQYHQEEQEQAIMAQNFESSGRSTYVVPIIFHVVHNPNNPAENVSQAAIYNLLDAVNEDFTASNSDIGNARTSLGFVPADADITFCLAQRDPMGNQLTELGIHRVSTTEDYYNPDTETNKMKSSTGGGTGTAVWDRTKYVNVWICDITNGASSGTAGYAYKPTVSTLPPASIDGIVIDYNLGMPPTNRVLTHEIGHYLGLSHTWGATAGTGCTSGNDGLTDTPITAGPSFDYSLSCTGLQQTCPGTNTQYENYMDYANCTVMFTQEQANLMELVLTNSRNSLNSSNGCDPVNPVPPVANFVADITTVIQGGSVNFTDLSTNYPTSWLWTVTPSAGVTFIGGTTNTSQNPTMQFANTGLYTIELVATNSTGSDNQIAPSYINVVSSGGGTVACDTLRNYTSAEEANMTAYGVTGGDGFFPGNLYIPLINGTNNFELRNVCDSFFVSAPTQVRRLYLPVFQADDMGGANNITFTVWNNNGATPGPGAVIGTQVVPITDLNAGQWNEIDFTTPVPVNGEFWVGYQIAYTGALDTVIFATTDFSDRPAGPGTTWIRGYAPDVSLNFAWQSVYSFFTSDPNSSLVMDVLCSNGPNPTAVVSFPTTESCEGMPVTMNGFGSTNTTSYYWDISDGTTDYFYDEANLTTSFPQGNWTIQLLADGSCKTATSPVYNLTINPPLSVNFAVTNENCTAQDGQVVITATGGDGGPYTYSINTGATFQAGWTYTNLNDGNYTVITMDANNCIDTSIVSVGITNTFNPSITPDATILPGTNTTLTVTGGVSWTWYAGVDVIGTTASINVAPLVTTTYVCNVVDASGCEAELNVTLTVIDDIGFDENLLDGLSIYPNPSNGQFIIDFNYAEPKNVSIQVVNIVGDVIYNNNVNSAADQQFTISLNDIADGIYFVTLRTETETATVKLIIKK